MHSQKQKTVSFGRVALLNISGDAGALILFTSPTLIDSWIDLIPMNSHKSEVRALVCKRNLPEGVSFAAVFPRLRPGIYNIEGSDQKVTIASGSVTTLDYREECCRIYYHPSTMTVLTTVTNHEIRQVTVDDCGSSEVGTLIVSEHSTLKTTIV